MNRDKLKSIIQLRYYKLMSPMNVSEFDAEIISGILANAIVDAQTNDIYCICKDPLLEPEIGTDRKNYGFKCNKPIQTKDTEINDIDLLYEPNPSQILNISHKGVEV